MTLASGYRRIWPRQVVSVSSSPKKTGFTGMNSRCQEVWALLRRRSLILSLPASGGCRHSLACGPVAPISDSVVTLPPPLLSLVTFPFVSVNWKKKKFTTSKLRAMFYSVDILRTSSLGDSISTWENCSEEARKELKYIGVCATKGRK